MKSSILLIGDGPFALALAKIFRNMDVDIIMTTIYENRINEIRNLGYIPIYVQALNQEGCKKIYETSVKILGDYSLKLDYIIHTARHTFYEFNLNDPPEDVKNEMFMVNSESPKLLAEYFHALGPHFIYTSSLATRGFKKDLTKHAIQDKEKPIGTKGLKHYSYTKRLGEENLYNFFKFHNNLQKLTIICVGLMFGTNFFKDMGVSAPTTKAWDEKQTADYIIHKFLKGKKRIYPGLPTKLLVLLPSRIIANFLDKQQVLKPLEEQSKETLPL